MTKKKTITQLKKEIIKLQKSNVILYKKLPKEKNLRTWNILFNHVRSNNVSIGILKSKIREY